MDDSPKGHALPHLHPDIYFELVEHARSIILKMDIAGRIVFANRYALNLFEYTQDELIGKPAVGTIVPRTDSRGNTLVQTIANICSDPENYFINENENISKNGKSMWVLWANTPSFNDDGTPAGVLCIGHDITERKQTESELNYLSTHDPLTDLYNRAKFDTLTQVARPPVSVIVCDVDGLKLVNDSLGHEAGDTLLKSCATILRSCFRDGDAISRIGGDEFAVILPTDSEVILQRVLERIHLITTGFNREHPQSPPVHMSVGHACCGNGITDVKELFSIADKRMYAQKDLQRGKSYDALHTYIAMHARPRD